VVRSDCANSRESGLPDESMTGGEYSGEDDRRFRVNVTGDSAEPAGHLFRNARPSESNRILGVSTAQRRQVNRQV
jgi:hypothetical protein